MLSLAAVATGWSLPAVAAVAPSAEESYASGTKALEEGDYEGAVRHMLDTERIFLQQAEETTNPDNRAAYVDAACAASALPLDSVPADHPARCELVESLARLSGVPESLSIPPEEVPHCPTSAEAIELLRARHRCPSSQQHVEAVPPAVEVAPIRPPDTPPPEPPPPGPEPRSKRDPLVRIAAWTGGVGGSLLVASIPMALIAGRVGNLDRDCENGAWCPDGSYNKVYGAAKSTWKDSNPSNDVPYGKNDHLCSDAAIAASDEVQTACAERRALTISFAVTAAAGSALALTSLVAGITHVRRARRGGSSPGTLASRLTVFPIVGRTPLLGGVWRF